MKRNRQRKTKRMRLYLLPFVLPGQHWFSLGAPQVLIGRSSLRQPIGHLQPPLAGGGFGTLRGPEQKEEGHRILFLGFHAKSRISIAWASLGSFCPLSFFPCGLMFPKWSEFPKLSRACPKGAHNYPKMVPRWLQHCFKMDQHCPKRDPTLS